MLNRDLAAADRRRGVRLVEFKRDVSGLHCGRSPGEVKS